MTKTLEQKSRLYYLWCGMRSRCNYTRNTHYKNYGAKGIRVCKEWDDFLKFKKWALQNGYNPDAKRGECTLDRINNDGNYEPNNCRFISNKEQCNNKTTNIYITYKNRTHTLKEWSEITGIKAGTLQRRYHNGWNIEKILNTPPIIGRNQYK